ncbi:hypothetical protein EWM64_g589 [Hericium alpestre]|uniref:Cytochrome P450 n=1 Tax=Hericium alpestre TaxID=135208 RepID=A0A4Z0AAR2_9AGAM|nr:hypothetical protein EWM64_g589 [Hericium alpestre]
MAFSTLLKRYLDTRKSSQGLSYPPGPKALPIIGNLLDIPKETPWVTYTAWAKQYDDVISVTAFGKVIVVVNSAKAAKEVFERRGTRYMDRPRVPILDLIGWGAILALMPYSEAWPFQTVKTHAFLNQLLSEPEQFREHIKHFVAAIVMSLTYGYDVKAKDDFLCHLLSEPTGLGESLFFRAHP